MDRIRTIRWNRKTEKTIFLMAVVACLAVAPMAGADVAHVQLETNGLDDLGPGWVYEGWVIEGGVPISTGTFTVAADGTPSQMYFTADVGVQAVRHIVGGIFNETPAPQIIIQRMSHVGFVQAKQHVDTGRLNIGVNHANP